MTTAELQRKLTKTKERKALLSDYQTRCQDSPTGQVNLTAPGARQLRKHGKSTVGYNVQAAVDAKNHLIATIQVTQSRLGANERPRPAPKVQLAASAVENRDSKPKSSQSDSVLLELLSSDHLDF